MTPAGGSRRPTLSRHEISVGKHRLAMDGAAVRKTLAPFVGRPAARFQLPVTRPANRGLPSRGGGLSGRTSRSFQLPLTRRFDSGPRRAFPARGYRLAAPSFLSSDLPKDPRPPQTSSIATAGPSRAAWGERLPRSPGPRHRGSGASIPAGGNLTAGERQPRGMEKAVP